MPARLPASRLPPLPQWVSLDQQDDSVRSALTSVEASYRKGSMARHQALLEPAAAAVAASCQQVRLVHGRGSTQAARANDRQSPVCLSQPRLLGQLSLYPLLQAPRLPRNFRGRMVTRAQAEQAAQEQGPGWRRSFPPAAIEPDLFTVLKFHPLDDAMLHCGEPG